jgi:TolB-like protein/class 3 adenylate cyclase/rhodanese-related sulfurtransferase/tetratricopeptide (TPR) repeat protein
MSEVPVERRLAAIFAADIVGYSRLIEDDEGATLAAIKSLRAEVIDPLLKRHHGRIAKLMGDGAIIEFGSVVDAVACAVAVQKGVAAHQTSAPPERRIVLRIGINLGDVVVEGEDLLGDGVNVAARLEQLCDAGGILVSGAAYDQLQGKLGLPLDFTGEQQVKNIARPVRTYRVRMDGSRRDFRLHLRRLRKWRAPMAAALVLAIAGFGVWLRPWETHLETASIARMALPLPDKPSIVVLPFENMSADPEQGYFADGMTEDLITDLSKLSGIFVIARNSSWTYKGKSTKPQQVAEELGVRYVLEGSVQRQGDRVRINAQLIDAIGGHHLWADRYDGTLSDVFALQDKVIGQIVAAMAVKLTTGERVEAGETETDNPQAYDALLQGWDHLRQDNEEETLKAVALFEKAIELDPDYSRAYASLAAANWRISLSFWFSSAGAGWEHAYESLNRNLAKAMEKPTSLAYAISSQLLAQQGRYDEAFAAIDQAMELAPNDPDNHVSKARILNATGRAAEAEQQARLAMRLDPRFAPGTLRMLAISLFSQEKYEDAVNTLKRVMEQESDVLADYATLVSSLGHLGRTDGVKAAIDKYNEIALPSAYDPLTVQESAWDWYGIAFNYHRPYIERVQEGLRKAGVPEGAGTDLALDDYVRFMTMTEGEVTVNGTTKVDAAKAKVLRERGVPIVDVRAPLDYANGHVPGAVNLSLVTDLSKENLAKVADKEAEVAFYCHGKHCPYSAYASAKAVAWGYTHIFYFAGGFPEWQDADYPVEAAPVQ